MCGAQNLGECKTDDDEHYFCHNPPFPSFLASSLVSFFFELFLLEMVGSAVYLLVGARVRLLRGLLREAELSKKGRDNLVSSSSSRSPTSQTSMASIGQRLSLSL